MTVRRRHAARLRLNAWLHGQHPIYVRDLLRELVVRDMKLRYKRSMLGIAWSLINPLAQLLILVFLFQRALRLDIPNYPSFAFTGVLAYNWFQASLFLAAGAITDNRELIKRPRFPAAVLPVVTVTTNFIQFLLALPILLLFIVLDGGKLTGAVLALPVVIMIEFLLILALGYLVATFQVTFRDTQHLLDVLLRLFFFLTPVFYAASAIPEPYQILYRLNPVAHLITAYRTILLLGDLPDFRTLLILGVFAAGLLWLGYTVFVRASHRFVEEL
jgi:lipopolysaccharide transport system permease protein